MLQYPKEQDIEWKVPFMKAEKLDCPYCGGSITADIAGRTSVFCSYCGQRVFLDDGKQEFLITRM